MALDLDLWITERNIAHYKGLLLTEHDGDKRQEVTEHLAEARKMKALLESKRR
jgi:nitrous oxide reductase accessory protein NosL